MRTAACGCGAAQQGRGLLLGPRAAFDHADVEALLERQVRALAVHEPTHGRVEPPCG
ncbi:MAG: hypothetical protein M0026_01125 [Nocardiopsaceae bacterium]|nr:hypothetical protein [Nocardiopsaceae bacterium]